MMFVKMLSQFGKKMTISSTIIPDGSEFLGVMEACVCPNCEGNRIYMLGNFDNNSLTVKCDDCGLEMSHSNRKVIEKMWESPKETTCPNCNTLFNLLIEKGLA